MKREKTSIPNVVRYPDGSLYYRKGDIEQSLGTKSEKEAALAKEFLELKTKAFGVKAFTVKMKVLVPQYLKWAEEEGKYRPRSLDEIQKLMKKLNWFFGNKKMSDIDEFLWNKYTKLGEVSDYSNHRKVMNLFLKWARANKFYMYRPEFDIPDHDRRPRKNLTPDQVLLLFQFAEREFLLFCALTLLHQMRGLEAESIKVADVNFERKMVTLAKEKDKNKRGRSLPLNDFALELIKEQIERVKSKGIKSPWLFPNKRDPKRHISRSGLRKQWFKVQRQSDGELDELQWHDFRATGEKHSHKSTLYTDAQREKFAGSSVDVQKRIYLAMDADDLRGLENVVQVEGLNELLLTKIHQTSLKGSGK